MVILKTATNADRQISVTLKQDAQGDSYQLTVQDADGKDLIEPVSTGNTQIADARFRSLCGEFGAVVPAR